MHFLTADFFLVIIQKHKNILLKISQNRLFKAKISFNDNVIIKKKENLSSFIKFIKLQVLNLNHSKIFVFVEESSNIYTDKVS